MYPAISESVGSFVIIVGNGRFVCRSLYIDHRRISRLLN